MANQLKAAKVLSIIDLRSQGWSLRRIARELGVSRGAVARQVRLAPQIGQTRTRLVGLVPRLAEHGGVTQSHFLQLATDDRDIPDRHSAVRQSSRQLLTVRTPPQ